MSSRKLWYVRRQGEVSGPFPTQMVTSHALLGRFHPSDEVSLDRVKWYPLAAVKELLPPELLELQTSTDPEHRAWLEERLKAARRWADERLHDERRAGENQTGQRLEERRQNRGNPDVLAFPHHHPAPAENGNLRRFGAAAAVAGVVLLLTLVIAAYYEPANPVKVGVLSAAAGCKKAAAPRVDWSGCDRHGILLRGVDLSGANLAYAILTDADLSGSWLRRANLTGTNLARANLSHSDLSGADLSYADLRGANLNEAVVTGVTLDQALWIDGRQCGSGSLGHCR